MGKFVNLEKLGYDSYDGIVVASYQQYSPEHNNLGRIAVTVSILNSKDASCISGKLEETPLINAAEWAAAKRELSL